MMKTFKSLAVAATFGRRRHATASAAAPSSRFRFAALLLSSVGLFAPGTGATAALYRFTDLGSGGAAGINNAGQVVGSSRGTFRFSHATVWNGTTATDLGTLFGDVGSEARAINSAGQVVGSLCCDPLLAVRWNGTTPTFLSTLGGQSSDATGINDKGQVVGWSTVSTDSSARLHATLWSGTNPIDLRTPGGTYSAARDINNAGQIVGFSLMTVEGVESPPRAIVWNGTVATVLGTLGGKYADAYAINDAGQIVGFGTTGDGTSHAILWNGTTPKDLGTLGGDFGQAFGINDSGQIVGTSTTIGYDYHAALWDGTTITDLNSFLDDSTVSAGWVLASASGINDKGWISGTAINRVTNEYHAYLLAVVPEPQTYALTLTGLGVLGLAARRRQRRSASQTGRE